MTIRVVIADDQPLVRAGFATMVGYAEDLELVGEAETALTPSPSRGVCGRT